MKYRKAQKRGTFSVRPFHYLLAGDLSRVLHEPVASLVERLLVEEAKRVRLPFPSSSRVLAHCTKIERLANRAAPTEPTT